MHDLVIDNAVVVDGLGGPPMNGGVHGVWVNGVRTVDERGVIRDCGRPGRVLREFAA